MTEKLWQVRWGSANSFCDPNLYRRHPPSPEAAIFLEDFPSIKAAASYLQTLMHNRTKWIRHVNWKAGDFSDDFMDLVHHSFATLACDLCDKYGNELLPSKVPLPAVHLTHCMSHLLSGHGIPKQLPRIDPKYGFDAILVTHYSPLKERKRVMTERVERQLGVKPTFVEMFNREHIDNDTLTCVSDREAQLAYIGRQTTRGEDSLSLTHMAVYHYVVEHASITFLFSKMTRRLTMTIGPVTILYGKN